MKPENNESCEITLMSNFNNLPNSVDGCRFKIERIGAGEGLRGILRSIRGLGRCDAILLNMDAKTLLLLAFLRTLCPFGLRHARLISVDLVLSWPKSRRERALAKLKAWILKQVDLFVLYVKQTEGYEQQLHLGKEKFRYVPFKVNFQGLVASTPTQAGDYVLTCGKSNRDFETFCQAMSGLDVSGVILTPTGDEGKLHGTRIDKVTRPANVQLIHDDGSAASWIAHLANARMLVLPISSKTISPSGLSAYLVAMAMGKCVVISECPASSGILSDGVNAVLVPVADPQALRSAILALWSHDSWRNEIASRGRDYALSLGGEETLHANLLRVVIESVSGHVVVSKDSVTASMSMKVGSVG